MVKLIDSHAHLREDVICDDELKEKVDSCEELEFCIIHGANVKRSKQVVDFAKQNEKFYACVGFHPEDLAIYEGDKTLNEIEKLAKEEKVVGIGEIGLDYHCDTDRNLQKIVFEKQLVMAKRLKMPVCIHCREAKEDMFEILSRHSENFKYGVIIHCFSEDEEYVQKFVNLGCYISFCGNFTFKKYNRDVIKFVPQDKLLVETDSPFLAPVPHRGEINNPINVLITANALAEALGIDFEKVCEITRNNTKRVYNLK